MFFQQGSPIKERAPHRLPCFPIPQLKRSGGLSSKAEMGILLFPKHKRGRHLCLCHWSSLSPFLLFVMDHLFIFVLCHWSSFHPPGSPFPPLHARQVLCESPHIFPKPKLSKRSRQSSFSRDSGCLVFLTYLYFEQFCISDLNTSIFSTILNFNTRIFDMTFS